MHAAAPGLGGFDERDLQALAHGDGHVAGAVGAARAGGRGLARWSGRLTPGLSTIVRIMRGDGSYSNDDGDSNRGGERGAEWRLRGPWRGSGVEGEPCGAGPRYEWFMVYFDYIGVLPPNTGAAFRQRGGRWARA